MMWFLQISVSLLFFMNKVFVLIGKKSGWLLGAIAASLAIFYFYFIGLYVYTVLEVGLVILMGYGFFKKEEKNPRVETTIRVVTIAVMLIQTTLAFKGMITIVELGSSLGLVIGTFLLTHQKVKAGWILYGIAHILAAVLGYNKGQQFFADFQIASALVSFVGCIKK
jgi:hypothetical protein